MNEDKRQRHKSGHRSRMEAARAAEAKRKRTRRLFLSAGAVVLVVGLIVIISVTRDDGSDDAAATTTAPAVTSPPVTAPPAGATIKGTTPCPAADGSAERTTAFAKAPPTCIDAEKTYSALVSTSEGDITVALDPKQSPEAVNNFVVLARYHYFDGLPFHRIASGFVDQTGSSGVPDIGNGGPGYDLPTEKPTREYAKGDVAMAQGGGKTSGSQFFFTIDPTSLQGGTYPIIGNVSKGSEVVDAINTLGDANDQPTKPVTITKVTITEA